jgi:hypothetical protein
MKSFFTKIWNWIKGLFSKKEQVVVPAPKKNAKVKKPTKTTKKGK